MIRNLTFYFCLQNVDASSWVRAAAEASLFTRGGTMQFRKISSCTHATLSHFFKESFCIRPAFALDEKDLQELERKSWAQRKRLQSSVEQIRNRIKVNPRGQFVLIENCRILGILYTQNILESSLVFTFDASEIENHFMEDGRCLQLLSVVVDPEHALHGYGRKLINFCKSCASLSMNIDKIIAVTRCSSFSGYDLDSLAKYISENNGVPSDPTLAFHRNNGATIHGLVPNYKPWDVENLGAGVLIEYPTSSENLQFNSSNFERPSYLQNAIENESESTCEEDRIQNILFETLSEILSSQRMAALREDMSLGWMQAGMDSLQLMQLRARMEQALQMTIQTEFFFECPNPVKAIQSLAFNRRRISVTFSESKRASSGIYMLALTDNFDSCNDIPKNIGLLKNSFYKICVCISFFFCIKEK